MHWVDSYHQPHGLQKFLSRILPRTNPSNLRGLGVSIDDLYCEARIGCPPVHQLCLGAEVQKPMAIHGTPSLGGAAIRFQTLRRTFSCRGDEALIVEAHWELMRATLLFIGAEELAEGLRGVGTHCRFEYLDAKIRNAFHPCGTKHITALSPDARPTFELALSRLLGHMPVTCKTCKNVQRQKNETVPVV